jgi:hypothetical protein
LGRFATANSPLRVCGEFDWSPSPDCAKGKGIAHESLTKLFLGSEALGDATVGAPNKDVYFDPRETHG